MVRSEKGFARSAATFAVNTVLVVAVAAGAFYAIAPAIA